VSRKVGGGADVKAKSIMLNNIRACSHLSLENRIERIEMPLARLILTISHLDEEWNLEGMKVRARYVPPSSLV
jgi:hypothetical protein